MVLGMAICLVIGIIGGAALMYFLKPKVTEVIVEVVETYEEAVDRLTSEIEAIEEEILETLHKIAEAGDVVEDALKEQLADLEAELEAVKDELAEIFQED